MKALILTLYVSLLSTFNAFAQIDSLYSDSLGVYIYKLNGSFGSILDPTHGCHEYENDTLHMFTSYYWNLTNDTLCDVPVLFMANLARDTYLIIEEQTLEAWEDSLNKVLFTISEIKYRENAESTVDLISYLGILTFENGSILFLITSEYSFKEDIFVTVTLFMDKYRKQFNLEL